MAEVTTKSSQRLEELLKTAIETKATSLNLSHMNLGDEEAICQHLNLSYNKIGPTGARAIAEVLPKFSLKSLNLSGNVTIQEGILHLAIALQNPRCQLTSIDLSRIDLSHSGEDVITRAICNPSCQLSSINLDCNRWSQSWRKYSMF